MKNIFLGVSTMLGLISLVSAHTGTDDYAHHGMMSCFYSGGFTGMNFFGWFFTLLALVALVLLVVWLIKQIQKK